MTISCVVFLFAWVFFMAALAGAASADQVGATDWQAVGSPFVCRSRLAHDPGPVDIADLTPKRR
jgi:hypothetical protein